MRKITAAIVFSTCSLSFQESAFASGASGMLCLDNVKLAYVNAGFVDGSLSEADADNGNGVYIGYYLHSGEIFEINLNFQLNIDDGAKGFSIYQSLNTALALGLKVSAWDHDIRLGGEGTCDDFDEVRLSY